MTKKTRVAAWAIGITTVLAGGLAHADGYWQARPAPTYYHQPPPCCEYANFGGLYIGLHGGYGVGAVDSTIKDGAVAGSTEALEVVTSPTTNGGVFGAHIVYNWQRGRIVLGLENDYSWMNSSGKTTVPDADQAGTDLSARSRMRRLASVRGRVGAVIDNAMMYFTAGIGFGTAELAVAEGTNSFSKWVDAAGLVVGGGAEYKINHDWTIRGEYLRYAFGENRHVQQVVGADTEADFRLGAIDVFRVGINYKLLSNRD